MTDCNNASSARVASIAKWLRENRALSAEAYIADLGQVTVSADGSFIVNTAEPDPMDDFNYKGSRHHY